MNGELLEKVKVHYENFEANDLDRSVSVFDPGVETVTPGATMHGIAEFRAFGEVFKAAFPDSGMTILSAIESADAVAIEGVFWGTHTGTLATPMGDVPATGRSMELPFADLFRFERGRIMSHHVYWDQVTLMTQLGLMPGPADASS